MAAALMAALLLPLGQAAGQEAKPAAESAVEREFRKLLELDDKAHKEERQGS